MVGIIGNTNSRLVIEAYEIIKLHKEGMMSDYEFLLTLAAVTCQVQEPIELDDKQQYTSISL